MIELTETAADALHTAIASTATPIAGLRLSVLEGGCSGYKYQMSLVEKAEPTDLSYESRGVAVFIDPSSLALISGTTIDYIDGLEGAGFAFNNLQAKSTCGCGNSFC